MPTNSSPATEIESIKADLTALREDIASLSRALLKGGVKKARAVRDAAEQQLAETTESVEELVQERPFTMLAIAFGAGALVTALFFRR